MIIGLVGNKQCGKDTCADYLVTRRKFVKMAFADPLKESARCMMGFNDRQLYGDQKEVVDSFWNVTPRKFLQWLGTDIMRERFREISSSDNGDFWIKRFEKEIKGKNDNIIISDVRFINESKKIKELGGFLIKIKRNLEHDLVHGEHISEIELLSIDSDYTIDNSGSFEELYNKLDNIIYGMDIGIEERPNILI